jgi:hypothetical protein
MLPNAFVAPRCGFQQGPGNQESKIMHQPITIYTPQGSPRLQYVLHWLFTEQFNIPWQLTMSVEEAKAAACCISYGSTATGISIPDAGLLFETGIRPQALISGCWNNLYTLFHSGDTGTLPFDLFSALFFLLTRYEEYTDPEKDRHGRYPAANSILSTACVLERPVVDEWVQYFHELLEEELGYSLPAKAFTFRPTYDIDIAWSYRSKGLKRTMGGVIKDLAGGRFASLWARCRTQLFNATDPYDAFAWMQGLHRQYRLVPRYFILAALRPSPFDKNISPEHPAMQQLIQLLDAEGSTGIHPSYFTNKNPAQFLEEKNMLEAIVADSITTSRQHYIRLFLPHTCRALIAAGITDDYSMGYATALGFRAGTGRSFHWYDLEREAETSLRMHPFCFMDTTAHYDLGLNREAAFERLRQMSTHLQDCGSVLTTVFHNFSLGTDPEWAGWREAYASFIAATVRATFV